MALVTPAGLLADFTFTVSGFNSHRLLGTISGDSLVNLSNGNEICVTRIFWAESGDSNRPRFLDDNNTTWDDWDDNVSQMAGDSFYLWDGTTLYEFVVSERTHINDDSMGWEQLDRPSSIVENAVLRVIYATAGQATVVSNFVRGIELLRPGTAFTYVVNNLEVTFTDTSTNDPTSWYWEFMGGQTSTQQNPTFTYTSAGTKVVTMTATNAQGSGSTITKRFATTEPPPPPAADPGLMLLTAGTNEDARFLVTAGTASEWYNSGTSVGSVTGDVDLPPTVGRIRLLSSNRFILNRGTGQNFSAYKSANSGKSLFVLTDTLIEFPLSAGSAGGGFIRWETTDAVWAVLDVISTGEKVLFVFADAGSVAKPATANLTPSAPTVANQTGVVSSAFTTTLPVGTGGDGTLTYGVSGLPSWASFAASTRILSGTPDATGVTTITYTVTDTDGDTATTTFTITIAAANKVPAAPTVANQTGVVSSAFTTTLPVGTGGDGTLTYGVSGLPSWASFAASTRILSGTPDATGVTTITYTVTDTDGDTATTTFTITIAAASLTPTGILADFTVTVTATITATAKGYIWWESRNVGTLKSGSDVTIDLEDSDDIVLDELIWNDSTPHFDLRPFLHRKSGSFSTAATELAGHSLYLWDGTTVYEQRFDAVSVIQADRVGWRSTPRPAGIIIGSVVRGIVADAGQSTKIKRLVQVAPVASFTSVVAELTVQFTDTSTEKPTSWAWDFGDGSTSTAQNPSHIYAGANTYTVTLTATNTIGSNAATAQVTAIAPPDLRPVAPVVPNETGIVGTSLSFTLPVGTGGDAPLAYLASGLPSWATFTASTRVLSGTPNATGVTTVTYTVTDTDGDTATVTFTITIAPKPRVVPTAPTVADQNGVVGTTFALSLPVGTGGDAPLTYLVSGLPSGLTFFANFRAVGGTPETAGISTVIYTITDNDGDIARTTFTITIAEAVLAPTLPTIAAQDAEVGTAFRITLPAARSGNLPIAYTLTNAPSWALFDVNTRVLSGTPRAIGVTTVTYTATDKDGDVDTTTFTITVIIPIKVISGDFRPEKLQLIEDYKSIIASWQRSYKDEAKDFSFLVEYKEASATKWTGITTTNTIIRIPTLYNTEYEVRITSIRKGVTRKAGNSRKIRTGGPTPTKHDYRIVVDWDDDNTFPYADLTHINNITKFVMEADWAIGFKEMFNKIAGRTECKLTLKNDTDMWSPENAASPYIQKGWVTKELRIYLYGTDDNGNEITTTQMFTGIIYYLKYVSPITYGTQRVEMIIHGIDQILKDTDFIERPQINVKPEDIIQSIVEYSRIRPTLRPRPLTLDLPGYNILGRNVIESPVDVLLDESYHDFPIVKQGTWDKDTAPFDAIADVSESSGGKVFINREGLLEYWNTLHWINTKGIRFIDRYTSALYEYLSDLQKDTTKNLIKLVYEWAEPSTGDIDLIYDSPEPVTINAGESQEISIDYNDIMGIGRIAGYVQFPTLSDFVYTGDLQIVDFTYDNDSAVLTILNSGITNAEIQKIKIYGTSIAGFGETEEVILDFESARDLGIRVLDIAVNLPLTKFFARNYIRRELRKRKDARGYVTKVGLETRDAKDYYTLHNYRIGDHIHINLPKMFHTGRYIIIGEVHKLSLGLAHHTFSYFLEPVPDEASRIGYVAQDGTRVGQPIGEDFLVY